MQVKIEDIKVGDVFSEESHYIVESISKKEIEFKHVESNSKVTLSPNYVRNLLSTCDQYEREMVVTKEDKADGTLGIRSIFEGIKSSEVFTVTFTKQGKPKSAKQLKLESEKQREEALSLITKAKKSMEEAYKEALCFVQDNPISDTITGEERVLRGYKVQFNSRDGKYNCVDVDLLRKGETNYIRPVNINTITTLVVDGIMYKVK